MAGSFVLYSSAANRKNRLTALLDRPELTGELEASFCSTDPIIAKRFAEATFFADNRANLPAVLVPSLIMQCSDDMIAPNVVGDYLSRAEITPTPNAYVLRIVGLVIASHNVSGVVLM